MVKSELLDSKVISMGMTCSRPKLKKLPQRKIPDVELHKVKHANEPERVSIKCTRDAAIQLTENRTDADMKALYDAASVLRRAISKAHHWSFSGSLFDVEEGHLPNFTELYSFSQPRKAISKAQPWSFSGSLFDVEEGHLPNFTELYSFSQPRKAISKAQPLSFSGSLLAVDDEHLPKELYSFFRWVIQGPDTTLSSDAKSSYVNRNAISLAHTRKTNTQTLKTTR